jgi:hypothetical protein
MAQESVWADQGLSDLALPEPALTDREPALIVPPPRPLAPLVEPLREPKIRSLAQQKVVIPKHRQLKGWPAPRTVFKPPGPVVARVPDAVSCLSLFTTVAGTPIDPREEKDRLLSIRRQVAVAQSLSIELRIRRIVGGMTDPKLQKGAPVHPPLGHVKVSRSCHML